MKKFLKKEEEEDSLTRNKEVNKLRTNLHEKGKIFDILKERILEERSLTKNEETIQRNIVKYFKDLKEESWKIKTYQYNTTHDIRYLFNEITKEDYYEPIETKSAFNGNYIEYESRRDNDDNLSLE